MGPQIVHETGQVALQFCESLSHLSHLPLSSFSSIQMYMYVFMNV